MTATATKEKARQSAKKVEAENRKEYLKRMKSQLDSWNAELLELEAEAKKSGKHLDEEYKKQIEQLKSKRDDTEAKIKEIQAVGESAWEDVKQGLEDAWHSVSRALKSAKAKIISNEKTSKDVQKKTSETESSEKKQS